MKTILFLGLIITLMSCGVTVNYDYEKSTDFKKYKSFDINDDGESGLSALDNKRLNRILINALQARGFIKADSTADFYINIKSSEFQPIQRNTVGVGVGGSGRNVGGGISIGLPIGQSKVNRQIVFDFMDSNTNQLFWQAVSESDFNPDSTPNEREATLKSVVEKVLKGYPPKTK
ncbi:DUF4136 domain-containing protein [Lacinutrix salivirga]